MPRIAYRLWLKDDPEGIETYVRWHLDPFDGLYDLIRGAGIKRYTIWLDGTDLFLTREGETPEVGEKLDPENDPVHRRWSDTMRPLFQERARIDGPGRPMLVFSMDPDSAPGPVEGQVTYRAGLRPGEAARAAAVSAWEDRADALARAFRAAGVRRAWTWVEEGSTWTYLEADALDAAETALAADPAWADLLASLADLLDEPTAREGWRRTREVFRCD